MLYTFYLSIISILFYSLIFNVLTSFIFISLLFFFFLFLGFSEFSGAMCARGVTGLDDLHTATNEFLGHFVDVVYQFQGDGKIHIYFHIFIQNFIIYLLFSIFYFSFFVCFVLFCFVLICFVLFCFSIFEFSNQLFTIFSISI